MHIIIVFFILIVLALINRKWAVWLAFLLLVWLFSFRTNEIPDTQIYIWMYDDPISRLDYNEIGYLYLGYIFKMYTDADFIAFYLTLVSICLIVWNLSMNNLLDKKEQWGVLLLLFMSFMGFFYLGITTRNCLSEVIVLFGISLYLLLKGWKRYLLYFLCVVLAMLIHRSAAFFLLLIPLFKLKISTPTYQTLYFVCLIIWLLMGSLISRVLVGDLSNIGMFSKLENYSTSAEASPSIISFQILSNWLLSFLAIRNKNNIETGYQKVYISFLKINFVGLFTLSLIWSVPTSYRFYNMFFFFNFILIYLMIFHNKRVKATNVKYSIAIFVSVLYFAILLHSFPEILAY